MTRLKKIARRTFLVGSAAIAGGVAFGVYTVRKPHPNPLLETASTGDAVFNPWVKIDAEGITLITPHADLGQGAQSLQAALIAEEMDIEFDQFTASYGVPSPAYYNTATADDIVPFLSTDRSRTANAARGVVGAVVKVMGAQLTGGSSTVPDSFDKLRKAGAVARETLKLAASLETGVPVADLRSANATVQLPDGRAIPYTDLAAIAGDIEPVQDVTLRDPAQWRLIGKPMQRLDIVAKSTGTLDYGIDLKIDGMLHASVTCNPRKGGAMNEFDASAAEGMRGVKKIVPVKNGVAVVADNTWRAFQAAEKIVFDWGPAPYPAEQAAHWDEVGKSFTDDRLDKEWRNDGDVEAALAATDVIASEYRAPYVAHQPLEPLSAIVKVTDKQADIWAAHQLPRFVEQRVADMTGLDVDNVHLHNQFVGGSFGHRLEFENIDKATEVAMQMKDTPIKLTFRREEDFAQDFTRQIGMSRARGSVKNGQVSAYDLN
ncbi:MAG: molybdopterin cofactor-binding domain-containing protein, partial [Sulfitobacter sp.]